jgi:G:T/U-mismatch repair DNA glycosylase
MPSPQSRLSAFYYGHKQNRFWAILEAVFGETESSGRRGATPQNVPRETPAARRLAGSSAAVKKQFLLNHRIALWDVLAECDITGASDASIRNPVANDFSVIFGAAPVRAVLTTGKTAYTLYRTLCAATYPVPFFYLPSPSPANCAMSLERITGAYREFLPRLVS